MDDARELEAPDSASLDTPETNPHPLQTQSAAQHRLHAPVQQRRSRIIDAFLDSNVPALWRRAEKLGLCGVSPRVRFETGRIPVCLLGRCRDRLCPTCNRFRSAHVRSRITRLVQSSNSRRFLTLTMPSSDAPLAQRIKEICEAFRRLRRTDAWKRHVTGGVAIIETKISKTDGHWHVHLHAIIEGSFFAHATLKAAWSQSVGSDAVCDIRAIHDAEKAVRYLTKYLAKDSDVDAWTDEQLREYATAFHRVRTLITFGRWHNRKLDDEEEIDQAAELPSHEIGYSFIADRLSDGTIDADRLVPLLCQAGVGWKLLLADWDRRVKLERVCLTPDDFAELTEILVNVCGVEKPPTASDANRRGCSTAFHRTNASNAPASTMLPGFSLTYR